MRTSSQRVEPRRLVSTGHRWYLLAWDRDRDGRHTFRADRVSEPVPTGPRFTPLEPPEDAANHVLRGAGSLHDLVCYLTKLNIPFKVHETPELRAFLLDLADSYSAASIEPLQAQNGRAQVGTDQGKEQYCRGIYGGGNLPCETSRDCMTEQFSPRATSYGTSSRA